MAVLSDYTSGTITVTQNSVNFTGTNTLWRTAQFREGDTVQLKGYTAIIAAASAADPRIASNTAGTFTEPWPGPSGTFAYRMRFMPDGARVTAQTTTLIELLGNGNLQALAGVGGATKTLPYFTGAGAMDALAGAADTMPYFTGVNGMGVTALTALARTILGRTTGAQIYGDLGAIPDPQLPDGINRLIPDTPKTDLNAIVENGTFLVSSTSTSIPLASSGFVVMMRQTASYGRQIYYQRDGSRIFTRNWTNNVWGPWTEIGGGNLVASGWIRLPSGLIIQWGTSVVSTSTSNLGVVPLNVSFPNSLYTYLTVNGDWGVSAARPQGFVGYPPGSNINQIAFACGVASSSVRVNWIAIGA
ncbi:pyocin knob domain-containing protein [Brucella intermedia]|uniref:pyocin knob domain-containing protein n=1 Tax=Brucella intermedia TaxID=94625 RepID=UPI00039784AB|nr:pyocin knob domain-containing protein [Brucella intermedia]ERI13512.1 hypothetical protein O206_08570 [Ochrobactrum sp. EGD-AQ16]OOC51231.1 hypothetical protein AS855_01300 [Brucella intermedia M86]